MAQEHGPWTIRESSQKYRDSFIDVWEDRVFRPDGQPGTYATVKMKSGVVILPIDKDRSVYLTKQFRYALGKDSIEVACGAIEENESTLVAAKRELQEELGIEANEWVELGFFNLDTSIVRCPVHLFLAKQLTFTQTNTEGTEIIETLCVPFNTAVRMVMNNQITHGPSCVLILKAYAVMPSFVPPTYS